MKEQKVPSWLILVTLAIGFIMATLDASIMNVAVATIQRDLGFTNSDNAWIIDGYLLSFASLLLLGGVFSERFGSKQIYLLGVILFIIGSISGGLSENSLWLIISRFFQGIGAAFFMPASLSLLVLSFEDKNERAKMLGAWSAIISISAGIGPFIGGALIYLLGWRSIFYINIPIGLLGLALAYRYAIKPEANKQVNLIFLPNLLSMIMLGSFAYTLIEGGTYGFNHKSVVISFLTFVLTAIIFIIYEKRAKVPLIPRELLKNKSFLLVNVIAFLLNACMFGGLFIFGLFLQYSNHSSAIEAGAQLIPMMIVFMIGNIIFTRRVTRFGANKMLGFGLSLAAIGTVLIICTLKLDYYIFASFYAIANLGVGIVVPAMTAIAMQRATDKYSNHAGAIFNVARQIGSLFGVALFGVVFYNSSTFVIGTKWSFSIMVILYTASIIISINKKETI